MNHGDSMSMGKFGGDVRGDMPSTTEYCEQKQRGLSDLQVCLCQPSAESLAEARDAAPWCQRQQGQSDLQCLSLLMMNNVNLSSHVIMFSICSA